MRRLLFTVGLLFLGGCGKVAHDSSHEQAPVSKTDTRSANLNGKVDDEQILDENPDLKASMCLMSATLSLAGANSSSDARERENLLEKAKRHMAQAVEIKPACKDTEDYAKCQDLLQRIERLVRTPASRPQRVTEVLKQTFTIDFPQGAYLLEGSKADSFVAMLDDPNNRDGEILVFCRRIGRVSSATELQSARARLAEAADQLQKDELQRKPGVLADSGDTTLGNVPARFFVLVRSFNGAPIRDVGYVAIKHGHVYELRFSSFSDRLMANEDRLTAIRESFRFNL